MNFETFKKSIEVGDYSSALEAVKKIDTSSEDFVYCLLVYAENHFKSDCHELTIYFVENTDTNSLIAHEITSWVILLSLLDRNAAVGLVRSKKSEVLTNSFFWAALSKVGNHTAYYIMNNCQVPDSVKSLILHSLYVHQHENDNASEIIAIEELGIRLPHDASIFAPFTHLNRKSTAMSSAECLESRMHLSNTIIRERSKNPQLYNPLRYHHHYNEFSHFHLAYIAALTWSGELSRDNVNLDIIIPELTDVCFLNNEYQIELHKDSIDTNNEACIYSLSRLIRHTSLLDISSDSYIGYNNISLENVGTEDKLKILEALLPALPGEVELLT
ncbi:hypothetical protein F7U66_00615 [Vibrio parahaemolyticus]|nr:hypothetical protein [Vibrio parahaemolyticus]